MAMRRSAPCDGLTISGPISAAMMSGHSPGWKSKPAVAAGQPAQEFGELFAGISCIELGKAALRVAAQRFEGERPSP